MLRASVATVAALAAGSLAAGLWLALRDDGGQASDQLVGAPADPGPVHVHGLGVNPADDRLYVASHTGLFRLDDGGAATRIGERYQDTMALTITGADRFLASGHPDLRDPELRVEGKPPLLGLIESVDAGRSWQPLSLLGDADLHAMVASGGTIVGYDSTGERVLASGDGGRTWETRAAIALADLAGDPANPDQLAGLTVDGDIVRSADGGRTWQPMSAAGAPTGVVLLRWGDGRVWAGTADGVLAVAAGDGPWTVVRQFGGAVEAIAVDGTGVYAATSADGIVRSDDGGATWTTVFDPQ